MKLQRAINHTAVMSDLNGRLMLIGKADFVTPPVVRNGGEEVSAEEVGFKLKRLYTLSRKVDREYEKLAAREGAAPLELELKREFRAIVRGLYRLQVWREYPGLAGKPFEIYADWRIGPKKEGAGVPATHSKEPSSTREVSLAGILELGAAR